MNSVTRSGPRKASTDIAIMPPPAMRCVAFIPMDTVVLKTHTLLPSAMQNDLLILNTPVLGHAYQNLQNRDTVVPNARTQPSSTRANNRHGFGWQVLCTAAHPRAAGSAAPITLAETGPPAPGLEISGFRDLGAMQTDTDQVEVTRPVATSGTNRQHFAQTGLADRSPGLLQDQ